MMTIQAAAHRIVLRDRPRVTARRGSRAGRSRRLVSATAQGLLWWLIATGQPLLAAQEQQDPPTDTAAWALSRYATQLRYEDLPREVVENAKRRILDTLGVALGAYESRPITILREVVVGEGGRPEATVIGSGQRTSAFNATLVNGAMIRYLDFNDTYWAINGYMHPSNSIAEALAVAERQHASGRDLIVATVLAYEIQSRLADTFRWPGFQQHSAAGFTAPIVAGKLLGLDAEQMANAIGIGASHNFALQGIYGAGYTSNMKSLGYAAGSASGVMAALLAQRGFTGPVTIIESYDRAFEHDASLLPLVAPRKTFAILQADTKRYQAYHVSHSAIAAVIDLVKVRSIKPEQINKVLVRGMPFRQDRSPWQDPVIPATEEDADHNLAFLLAMAIIDGDVGPEQFASQPWNRPQVRQLMDKVWFQGDAQLTADFPHHWTSVVEITTTDDRVYNARVDLPKGLAGNPMSDAEINAKVRAMASRLLPGAQIDRILDVVYHLEDLQDVSALMRLLVIPGTHATKNEEVP